MYLLPKATTLTIFLSWLPASRPPVFPVGYDRVTLTEDHLHGETLYEASASDLDAGEHKINCVVLIKSVLFYPIADL